MFRETSSWKALILFLNHISVVLGGYTRRASLLYLSCYKFISCLQLLIKVTAEVLFQAGIICYKIMLCYMSAVQNTNFGKQSSVSDQSDHMSTFHTTEVAQHLFCGGVFTSFNQTLLFLLTEDILHLCIISWVWNNHETWLKKINWDFPFISVKTPLF